MPWNGVEGQMRPTRGRQLKQLGFMIEEGMEKATVTRGSQNGSPNLKVMLFALHCRHNDFSRE